MNEYKENRDKHFGTEYKVVFECYHNDIFQYAIIESSINSLNFNNKLIYDWYGDNSYLRDTTVVNKNENIVFVHFICT